MSEEENFEEAAAKPGETKEEKFKRLAEPRVNRALDKIRLIGNLATGDYAYSPEQVEKIITSLQRAVIELRDKFHKRIEAKKGFKL